MEERNVNHVEDLNRSREAEQIAFVPARQTWITSNEFIQQQQQQNMTSVSLAYIDWSLDKLENGENIECLPTIYEDAWQAFTQTFPPSWSFYIRLNNCLKQPGDESLVLLTGTVNHNEHVIVFEPAILVTNQTVLQERHRTLLSQQQQQQQQQQTPNYLVQYGTREDMEKTNAQFTRFSFVDLFSSLHSPPPSQQQHKRHTVISEHGNQMMFEEHRLAAQEAEHAVVCSTTPITTIPNPITKHVLYRTTTTHPSNWKSDDQHHIVGISSSTKENNTTTNNTTTKLSKLKISKNNNVNRHTVFSSSSSSSTSSASSSASHTLVSRTTSHQHHQQNNDHDLLFMEYAHVIGVRSLHFVDTLQMEAFYKSMIDEFRLLLSSTVWKNKDINNNTTPAIDDIVPPLNVAIQRHGGCALYHRIKGTRLAFIEIFAPSSFHSSWTAMVVPPRLQQNNTPVSLVRCDSRALAIFTNQLYLQTIHLGRKQPNECRPWKQEISYRPRVLLGNTWATGSPPKLLQEHADEGGVLLICAPCASGKTFAIEQFLFQKLACQQRPIPILLDLAAGQNLVQDKCNRWRDALPAPFTAVSCYELQTMAMENRYPKWDHVDNNIAVIVSTRDSLQQMRTCKPHYVFIDEAHTIWTDFLSEIMMPRADAVFAFLCCLLRCASHVVFGEAFVDDMTMRLVQHVQAIRAASRFKQPENEPPVRFLQIYKPEPSRNMIFTHDRCHKQIIREICSTQQQYHDHTIAALSTTPTITKQEQEKIQRNPFLIVSQTLRTGKQVVEKLVNQGVVSEERSCFYSSESATDVWRQWMLLSSSSSSLSSSSSSTTTTTMTTDINQLIAAMDLFGYSPKIRAGTNLTHRFCAGIAFLSLSGCGGPVSFAQMLYRARHMTCTNMPIVCDYNDALMASFEFASPSNDSTVIMTTSTCSLQQDQNQQDKSAVQYEMEFWKRNLPLNMHWATVCRCTLNRPIDELLRETTTIRQRLHAEDQFCLALILERERQEAEDKTHFGRILIDCIIQNGDTFCMEFNIPLYAKTMLTTLSNEAHTNPSIGDLLTEHDDADFDNDDETLADQLENDPLLAQEISKIQNVKLDPEAWMNQVAFLRQEVVHKQAGTAQQKKVLEYTRAMIAFGFSTIQELLYEKSIATNFTNTNTNTLKKQQTPRRAASYLRTDRFCTLRDAYWGVYSQYMDEPSHIRLFVDAMTRTENNRHNNNRENFNRVFVPLQTCLVSTNPIDTNVSLPNGIMEDYWCKKQRLHEFLLAWMHVIQLPRYEDLIVDGSCTSLQEHTISQDQITRNFNQNTWMQNNIPWLLEQLSTPRHGFYGYETCTTEEGNEIRQLTTPTIKAIMQRQVSFVFGIDISCVYERSLKQTFWTVNLQPFVLLKRLMLNFGICA